MSGERNGRIKAIRAQLGLTQEKMAAALAQAVGRNVHVETYRGWERGKSSPPKDVAAFLDTIELEDGTFTTVPDPSAPAAASVSSGGAGAEDTAPGDDGSRLQLPAAPSFSSNAYARICAEMFDMVATAVGMIGAVTGNSVLQTDGLIIHGDKDELGKAWGKLAETNETFRNMLMSSEKQGAYLAIALATGTTVGKVWRNHAATNHDLETTPADVLNLVREGDGVPAA